MAPKSFLHLSTALKYGYDLQEMADIKESVGIIANDKEMPTEAANFINRMTQASAFTSFPASAFDGFYL